MVVETERPEVLLPPARRYRPASAAQIDYATFLLEMELGMHDAAATVASLPEMSSYRISQLIEGLRKTRRDRLRRERRRGW